MSKSRLLKPTILSLSFLSILSGAAVSPALGRIQQAFPDASDLTIQMILTLTPLFIIPFSLLTGRLSLKIKKRHILFVGLTIYLLAGVGGGLMNNTANDPGHACVVRHRNRPDFCSFPIADCRFLPWERTFHDHGTIFRSCHHGWYCTDIIIRMAGFIKLALCLWVLTSLA